MNRSILKFIRNTFLTTGITLIVLAIVAVLYGGTCIFVRTIFENLGANTCLHLAFMVTRRFESKYFLVDAAVDIAVIAGICLLFGVFFGWFSSTQVGVVVLMVVITYAISSAFQVFRVREDTRYINDKLKQRAKLRQEQAKAK